jgi:putative CocE/NonD family hydrolase
LDDVAPVKIFVMGIDQWRDEQDWPLPDTQWTDVHLTSAGHANTADGDGVLATEPPTGSGYDTYLYDPRRPVPTAGGACLPMTPGFGGPVDQRTVAGREDVLCFTGPVLEEPVEVTGPVSLTLFVSSSAVDTDFTAKLVDVFPDGKAINLCDGILRVRYRNGLATEELMKPGTVYEITIDMTATSNVFLPGHRIRLDVSSSNFPRYDRNTNTGAASSLVRARSRWFPRSTTSTTGRATPAVSFCRSSIGRGSSERCRPGRRTDRDIHGFVPRRGLVAVRPAPRGPRRVHRRRQHRRVVHVVLR